MFWHVPVTNRDVQDVFTIQLLLANVRKGCSNLLRGTGLLRPDSPSYLPQVNHHSDPEELLRLTWWWTQTWADRMLDCIGLINSVHDVLRTAERSHWASGLMLESEYVSDIQSVQRNETPDGFNFMSLNDCMKPNVVLLLTNCPHMWEVLHFKSFLNQNLLYFKDLMADCMNKNLVFIYEV